MKMLIHKDSQIIIIILLLLLLGVGWGDIKME